MTIFSSTLARLFRCGAALLASMAASATPQIASAQPASSGRAEVITLGTGGGPIVRLKRSEPANAVVIGDAVYLVDAGDRVLQQLEGAKLKLQQIKAIFITHHHLDHTAGVMPLLGIRWMTNTFTPLKLFGPPGIKAIIQGFEIAMQPSVDAGFGPKIHPLLNVDAQEVGTGVVYQDDNVKVSAVENTHYTAPLSDPTKKPKSYACRIETKHGVVVFTGDTTVSDAVTDLAKGADILVSEVIDADTLVEAIKAGAPNFPPQMMADTVTHFRDDHLSPEQVGQMATKAGVKQVVLSHIAPGFDSESAAQADARYAAGVRKFFKGPVTIASDLQIFPLSAQ